MGAKKTASKKLRSPVKSKGKSLKKPGKNRNPGKNSTKKLSFKQKYMYVNSWSRQGASETFIEMLVERMLDYFEDPKHLCMYEFLCDNGISWFNMRAWVKRHENLRDAYEFVRMQIGARREKQSMYKKYNTNPQTINPTLRYYHPDWRKLADEETAKDEKVAQKLNIVIPDLIKSAKKD